MAAPPSTCRRCARIRLRACDRGPMVKGGAARNALVVGAEIYSRILGLERSRYLRALRRWCGCGRGRAFGEPGILSSHLHADGHYRAILCVPGRIRRWHDFRHAVRAHGRKGVFKFAVQASSPKLRTKRWRERMTVARHRLADPAPGQHRIMDATAKKLGLASGAGGLTTVDLHANTSAASIPLALDVAVRDGRIQQRSAAHARRASAADLPGDRVSAGSAGDRHRRPRGRGNSLSQLSTGP